MRGLSKTNKRIRVEVWQFKSGFQGFLEFKFVKVMELMWACGTFAMYSCCSSLWVSDGVPCVKYRGQIRQLSKGSGEKFNGRKFASWHITLPSEDIMLKESTYGN